MTYELETLVPLTDRDREDLVEKLVGLHAELDDHGLARDAEVDRHKTRRKELEAAIEKVSAAASEVARDLRRGTISKVVVVEDRPIEATGVMQIYRVDTGEVIDERPMSLEERQGKLFDDEGENGPPSSDELGSEGDINDPDAVLGEA